MIPLIRRNEKKKSTKRNKFFSSKTFAAKLFLKLTESYIDPAIPCISILKFEPQNRKNEEIKKTIPWLSTLKKFYNFISLKEEENNIINLLMEFSWILFYKYYPKFTIIKRPAEKTNLFYLVLKGSVVELHLVIKNECLTEEEYIKHLIKMNILKEKEIVHRCLIMNKNQLNIENLNSIQKFCIDKNFDYKILKYHAKKELIELGFNLEKIDNVPSIETYIKASIVENEIKKKSTENTIKKYFYIPHYEFIRKINDGRFIGNLSEECTQDEYKTYISLESSDISYIDKKQYKSSKIFQLIREKMKKIFKDCYNNYYLFSSLNQNYFLLNYSHYIIYKQFEYGEKIFSQGSIYEGVYLIKEGEILIYTNRKIDELNGLIVALQNSLNGYFEYISCLTEKNIENENMKLNFTNPIFQSKEYGEEIKGNKEIVLGKFHNYEILGLNDCYNYKNDIYHFNAICQSKNAILYFIPKNIFNYIISKEENVKNAVMKIVELKSGLFIGALNNYKYYIAKKVAFKIGKVHLLNTLDNKISNDNNNKNNNSKKIKLNNINNNGRNNNLINNSPKIHNYEMNNKNSFFGRDKNKPFNGNDSLYYTHFCLSTTNSNINNKSFNQSKSYSTNNYNTSNSTNNFRPIKTNSFIERKIFSKNSMKATNNINKSQTVNLPPINEKQNNTYGFPNYKFYVLSKNNA